MCKLGKFNDLVSNFDTSFDEEWKRSDIYHYLRSKINEGFNPPDNISMYYMKITGYYPTKLLEGFSRCTGCPNNPAYRSDNDKNELLEYDEKEQEGVKILVLCSPYPDFHQYDITSCYINYDAKLKEDMGPMKSIWEFSYDKYGAIDYLFMKFSKLLKK